QMLRYAVEGLEERRLLAGAVQVFDSVAPTFVENQGQWADASVKYAYNAPGASIAFTDAGPVFALHSLGTPISRSAFPLLDGASAAGDSAGGDTGGTFSMSFIGAQPTSPVGQDRAAGDYN